MTQRSPWIDPRLLNLPPRPWRKIHLDFHNSQHIPAIGAAFDADEFGDRLVAAHVDSIVVFAKDMHGYFYYPSEYGPVHGGLTFDLLGAQVAACRARGINVYAYYCVTWDNYLAEHHPEWLVWKRDRTTYLPKFDAPPGWTALCLSHPEFVQLVLDHSRELVEHYALDGIWYDMPLPIGGECFCSRCLATLRERGLDPFDTAVQRRHKQELLVNFLRRSHQQAHTIRPGCQVDQNNQTRLGLGERAPYLDNIDIEALPTAFWGYLYFPTNVRYARTFGRSVCGMTGRFHRSWADFGGLKHPMQLRSEMAGIIAQGAQCDIGDQLPPDGRLDPAVYETIRPVYEEVRRLEPFLNQAAPVTEAAIVIGGLPLDDLSAVQDSSHQTTRGGSSVYGLTKLLMECHLQFDIIEPAVDFERYRLLILADELQVDAALAARLQQYLAGGGAIVGAHQALRLAGSDQLWLEGVSYAGESPYAPAYLRPDAVFGTGIPAYDFALYDGSAQWLAG
ncbi:MAG TPA: alpha-L-fucosidase, partial [Roseiflexaceae bacterium]|nr:alpha-L-fucosidase [Roseiflexaceae bacterium]